MASSEDQSIVFDWLQQTELDAVDRTCVVTYLDENEIGLEDLMLSQTVDDLDDIKMSNVGKEQLFEAIKFLKSSELTQKHESNENDSQWATGASGGSVASTGQSKDFVHISHTVHTGQVRNVAHATGSAHANATFEGGMIGLNNLGNTCFMNSAIQCLLHTPGFTTSLAQQVLVTRGNKAHGINENKDYDDLKMNEVEEIVVPDNWRQMVEKGDDIDAKDSHGWFAATIVKKGKIPKKYGDIGGQQGFHVHFKNYRTQDDLWYAKNSQDLAYPGTQASKHVKCTHWMADLKKGDEIDFFNENGEWVSAKIVWGNSHNLRVRYKIVEEGHFSRYPRLVNKDIKRFDTQKVAQSGTKTNTQDINRNNSSNSSQWTMSNMFGYGYDGYKQLQAPVNSFYEAWLDLITQTHLSTTSYLYGGSLHDKSSLSPRSVYRLMSKSNPTLGDGKQHDSNEALAVILSGIEESLPDSMVYANPVDTVYAQAMEESIYDTNYDWDLSHDIRFYTHMKQRNLLNEASNLVTSYFDGIEVQIDTCLECGFQRRLYNQFRELSLSVTTSFVQCCVIYKNPSDGLYNSKLLKLGDDATVDMLKYLMLWHIYEKTPKIGEKEMKNWEIVKINNLSNPKNINAMASILDKNEKVCNVINGMHKKNSALMLVKKYMLSVPGINDASGGGKVNARHKEVLHFQLSAKKVEIFNVCVVYVPCGRRNFIQHGRFESALAKSKIGLCETLSNTQREKLSITSIVNDSMCDTAQDVYDLNKSENIIVSFFSLKSKNKDKIDKMDTTDTSTTSKIGKDDDKMELEGEFVEGENENENEDEKLDDDDNDAKLKMAITNWRIMLETLAEGTLDEQLDFIDNRLSKIKTKRDSSKYYIAGSSETLNGMNEKFDHIEEDSLAYFVEAGQKVREHLDWKRTERDNNFSKLISSIATKWKGNDFFANCAQNNQVYDKVPFDQLKQCLEDFKERKFLTGRDLMIELKCNCNCKQTIYVSSEKNFVLGPKILIVALNRGKSEKYRKIGKSSYYSSYRYESDSKHNNTIKFDDELPPLVENVDYDLRAVCNHLGNTSAGGHYTADVKHLGTDEWHHCDDSSVEKHSNYSNYSSYSNWSNFSSYSHHSSNYPNYRSNSKPPYSCPNAILMIYAQK